MVRLIDMDSPSACGPTRSSHRPPGPLASTVESLETAFVTSPGALAAEPPAVRHFVRFYEDSFVGFSVCVKSPRG